MAEALDIPEAVAEALPPELRTLIGERREALSRQGIVQERCDCRGRSWRLRFRADDPDRGGIHRSVSLGRDPALAQRVRALLSSLRAQRLAREEKEEAERARAEEAARAKEAARPRNLREAREAMIANVGGGRRHRAELRREFNEVMAGDDRFARLYYILRFPNCYQRPPPRGRPRGAGTCLW